MNAQPAQQSVNSLTNSLASAFGSTNTPSRPKIIYASRTHSQLAKVASELKQTVYRPKMTILGSRQQLCVHPVVSKLEGAGQTHACRALTSEKACNFYEHLPTWTAENQHLQNAVLDIEDLMSMGREQHMCPYFYSRDRMAEAELVLLPYNYLIDPTIRSRLGLKFENSVLIFDEAHNLEGVCGDSASFDLSAADLAAAIQEVQKCIDTIRDPTLAAFVMDGSSTAGNDIPDLQSLAILKAILLEFEGLLDKQPLPDSGDGLTQPGEFIFQLLAQCKIQQENKDMLLELLDKSVTLLFADRGQDAQRKSCALDKFASAIKVHTHTAKVDGTTHGACLIFRSVSNISLVFLFFLSSFARFPPTTNRSFSKVALVNVSPPPPTIVFTFTRKSPLVPVHPPLVRRPSSPLTALLLSVTPMSVAS